MHRGTAPFIRPGPLLPPLRIHQQHGVRFGAHCKPGSSHRVPKPPRPSLPTSATPFDPIPIAQCNKNTTYVSHPIRSHPSSTTQHNTTQHKTPQHSTTQHNTTQHSTTQHNTTQNSKQESKRSSHPAPTKRSQSEVWGLPVGMCSPHEGTTQHNTTQHNTTQHNTTQHNTTQHNTTQHNTTQHNTTQHNTTQHNTTSFIADDDHHPPQEKPAQVGQPTQWPVADTAGTAVQASAAAACRSMPQPAAACRSTFFLELQMRVLKHAAACRSEPKFTHGGYFYS